jgi:hypothetical protein
MTVQLLKLKGAKYVLLKESDYRRLERDALQARQDRGDIAEAERRRATGPPRPWPEFTKKKPASRQ